MNDCVFCKIVAGELPSYKVYEDEKVYAFLDIHPVNLGHTLVVPKKHAPSFYELDEETFLHGMKVVQKLAQNIMQTIKPVRVGLVVAGWDVPHTHIHIIPTNDHFDITSKQKIEGALSNPSTEELTETAEKIRDAL